MNHINRKNCDIFSSPLKNNHDHFPRTSVPTENKVTLSAKCFECGRLKPVWATVRTEDECLHYCAYCWSCD